MRPLQRLVFLLLTVAPGTVLPGQARDTLQRLPELLVTVTRAPLGVGIAGLAVSVLDGERLRRGRTMPSLEDALAHVPGVLIRDRGDPSLDPRLTIRGAGARANFGARGVRVIVDGVPATLPDGQTPLTSLDLLLAERIEVARGPLAALHGNGSLGAISVETRARLDGPWRGRAGIGVGSAATRHWHAVTGGGGDRIGGLLAASGMTSDGWRVHAGASQLRLRASLQWRPSPRSVLTVRADRADDPRLESPGALTLAEFAADPSQPSPNSLRRAAGKRLEQNSLAVGWRMATNAVALEATAWLTGRTLANPIAAPAPAPSDPEEGIWIGIDRRVVGVRSALRAAPLPGTTLAIGVDAQRMVDDRINRRHRAGEVSGPLLLDQQERITELGPFVQVTSRLGHDLAARAGARHDRVRFTVDDHLVPAAGGTRIMAAWSAGASIGWNPGPLESWVGIGSAFETPTTTELANRPDGETGLNEDLAPARTWSLETGARWRTASVALELVAWRSATRDAITPNVELGGRSFYVNVGRTRTLGAELAATWQVHRSLTLRTSATWLDSRFGTGAIDAAGADIADHRLPGVPSLVARLGGTLHAGRLTVDLDHGFTTAMWADDGNTLEAAGWGPGITNAHLRWDPPGPLALVSGIRNVFAHPHVASVVANGGFGRVIEPGRPRSVMVGGEFTLGG